MNKVFLGISALLLIVGCESNLLSGCGSSKKTEAAKADTTTVATTEADSAICGVANDEFGMSTFALTTEEGTVVQVERTREDGTDGIIWGDVRPGDRFTLTTADHGTTLGTAINLTQVEKFTTDFHTFNDRLILHPNQNPDTVSIVALDADSLVAKGRQWYRMGRN